MFWLCFIIAFMLVVAAVASGQLYRACLTVTVPVNANVWYLSLAIASLWLPQ